MIFTFCVSELWPLSIKIFFDHYEYHIEKVEGGGGSIGRDRMVVGFTATCLISTYHHLSCEFESRSCRGAVYTKLCSELR